MKNPKNLTKVGGSDILLPYFKKVTKVTNALRGDFPPPRTPEMKGGIGRFFMKEAVIRMETTARPTTDRSASPRLLKGLLLAITLVALLATTVILCQQDIENPSYCLLYTSDAADD